MLPHHELALYLVTYQWVMAGVTVVAILVCWRIPSAAVRLLGLVIVPLLAAGITPLTGAEFFALARLAAYGLFLHVPVFCLVTGGLLWRAARSMAVVYLLCGLAVVAVAIDAFWIEPHWLAVTHYQIRSSKLSAPLRIAVIADFQTDEIGDYEREVLERTLANRPDLILWAGDYLQTVDYRNWHACCDALNQLLRQLDFRAPLGVIVVGGNADWPSWPQIFAGLPFRTCPATETISLTDELEVVGLSVVDSFRCQLSLPDTSKFRLILGHCPNFAMSDATGDLLVAGHTHGGQVRLPFIGPLKTNASIPRSWAAGLTDIGQGRQLVVSRGVGMERLWAPRLRFLCRPELVILDVIPE